MVPSYSSFRHNQPIGLGTPWWIFDDGCHDALDPVERMDLNRVECKGSQIVNMSLDLLAFNQILDDVNGLSPSYDLILCLGSNWLLRPMGGVYNT